MRINHNVPAIITQGALAANNRALSKDLEKLSTGLRINRAGDDAAGLAVSEGLRAQIKGVEQAKRNTLDGISALNIAEGAMNEIHAILQRQRELAIQSSTATYTNTERSYMEQEFQQLSDEIERIMKVTNFNKIKLLDGSDNNSIFVSSRTFLESNTVTDSAASQAYVTERITAINTAASAASAAWSSAGNASAALATIATQWTALTASTGASDWEKTPEDLALYGKFNTSRNELTTAMADVLALATGTGVASQGNNVADHVKAINEAVAKLNKVRTDLEGLEKTSAYAINNNTDVDASEDFKDAVDDAGDLLKALDTALKNVIEQVNLGSVVQDNGDLWVDANEVKSVDSIGVGYDVDMFQHKSTIATATLAQEAIVALDNAINGVSSARADIGAYVNRLEHTVTNLTTASANQQAAESQLRDVDFTYQSSQFTKNQILMQSATAMLSQANAAPQSVLSLLR